MLDQLRRLMRASETRLRRSTDLDVQESALADQRQYQGVRFHLEAMLRRKEARVERGLPPGVPFFALYHGPRYNPYQIRVPCSDKRKADHSIDGTAQNVKQRLLAPVSSSEHPMMTRRRASFFRILDLPAELRDLIYTAVVEPDTTPLDSFALPALLQTNRQIRKEALPVFEDYHVFTGQIGSTFCLRNLAFGTGIAYQNLYRDFDTFPGLEVHEAYAQAGIGMRNVRLRVFSCECCVSTGLGLGTLSLSCSENGTSVRITPTRIARDRDETMKALEVMRSEAEAAVKIYIEEGDPVGFSALSLIGVAVALRQIEGEGTAELNHF